MYIVTIMSELVEKKASCKELVKFNSSNPFWRRGRNTAAFLIDARNGGPVEPDNLVTCMYKTRGCPLATFCTGRGAVKDIEKGEDIFGSPTKNIVVKPLFFE